MNNISSKSTQFQENNLLFAVKSDWIQTTDPIFLIGCPRSGTTWLQGMLAAHSEIYTGTETHFFEAFAPVFKFFEHQQRNNEETRKVGLPAYLTHDQLCSLIRELFWSIITTLPGPPNSHLKYFLEKTPQHALHWEFILTIFPDARFIHLIRDARAVAASLLRASSSWGKSWAPNTAHLAALAWLNNVQSARKIAESVGSSQYFELKYEDLRQNPEGFLSQIFEWLDLSLDKSNILEIVSTNSLEKTSCTENFQHIPQNSEGYPKGFFGPAPSSVNAVDLDHQQRIVIDYLCGDLLTELGYQDIRERFSLWEKFLIHKNLINNRRKLEIFAYIYWICKTTLLNQKLKPHPG